MKKTFVCLVLAMMVLSLAVGSQTAFAKKEGADAPPGWAKGKKEGWGGEAMPPGLAKKDAQKAEKEAKKKVKEAEKAPKKKAKEAEQAAKKKAKEAELAAKKQAKEAEEEARKKAKEAEEAAKEAEQQASQQANS